MKINLTENQIVSFYNFLKATSPIEPKKFNEWGKDWIRTRFILNHLGNYIKDGVIDLSENEYWSVFNMLAMRVDEIKENKLGESLFIEMRDLFKYFHSKSGLSIPPPVFCYMNYHAEPRKVLTNLNSNNQ